MSYKFEGITYFSILQYEVSQAQKGLKVHTYLFQEKNPWKTAEKANTYLDKGRPLDPDCDREDADLDLDLDNERSDDFAFGDLLQIFTPC